jgi:hypothetical protein
MITLVKTEEEKATATTGLTQICDAKVGEATTIHHQISTIALLVVSSRSAPSVRIRLHHATSRTREGTAAHGLRPTLPASLTVQDLINVHQNAHVGTRTAKDRRGHTRLGADVEVRTFARGLPRRLQTGLCSIAPMCNSQS